MTHHKLVILGFGGHARSVADVALSLGYKTLCFIDPNARPDEHFLGHPVLPAWDTVDIGNADFFVASGDHKLRKSQCQQIVQKQQRLVSLVSPSASIGVGSEIESGTFVGHQAHIGPMAKIGQGCIINTAAVVEHECRVGDFSHVSINAALAGRSKIGQRVMLGAGATVIDGVSIADDVVIGAGAVVVKSIEAAGTYAGVPARSIT